MSDYTKIFFVIFIAVFFATSFANWKTTTVYKVDWVTATSTEQLSDYLNRMGKDGWSIFNYTNYSDGRQYIFVK